VTRIAFTSDSLRFRKIFDFDEWAIGRFINCLFQDFETFVPVISV
jgi:hypothetical protein